MELEILGMNFACVLAALADGKIPEKGCLLPLASKLLGYGIVAASTTVKLPQILKILKHGSVRGLSVASFELEVVGNYFGCNHLLLLPANGNQDMVESFTCLSRYCGLAPIVLGGKIDPALFEVLYASQHAIFFCARIPQIWKNFTNKGTGELSFLTCFMNFAGSIVRVFTSIQEKTPLSVILGSAIGIVMNGTLLGQIVMYQKPAPKKEKKRD
uniref:Mannose-P-dolichol utilization defect 1 protein homolog n=1 Tax=Leersia perrieri TaxID=77586 RepID=A0A0D9WYS2_9ORYZ